MNGGQMGGAVLAGFVVAAIKPGWALAICGVGLLGTVPLMLSLRVTAPERSASARHAAGVARGLVGIPLAYLAMGYRPPVRRGD